MKPIPYALSWVVTYFIILLFIALFCKLNNNIISKLFLDMNSHYLFNMHLNLATILLKTSFFYNSDMFVVFTLHMLFFLSIIGFCFIFAAFFNSSKIAGIMAPMLLLGAVLPRYIFFSTQDEYQITEKIGKKTNCKFIIWRLMIIL